MQATLAALTHKLESVGFAVHEKSALSLDIDCVGAGSTLLPSVPGGCGTPSAVCFVQGNVVHEFLGTA